MAKEPIPTGVDPVEPVGHETNGADAVEKACAQIAAQVDEQLLGQPRKANTLLNCSGQPVKPWKCAPLQLPAIAPVITVEWGDSRCDCIEGDDTEIFVIRVCNPYSNLVLSNFVIHRIVVLHPNGQPPKPLPDGSPSVQLVPIGPYCFGDIGPCRCVVRQFVLRLRGAVPGPYQIRIEGICFDVCLHRLMRACFTFNVCKD